MVKKVGLFYTETFRNTVYNLIDHLSLYSDELSVIKRVEKLIYSLESRAIASPHSCPINRYISFREYHLDGFCLPYQTTELKYKVAIQADVLLSQK